MDEFNILLYVTVSLITELLLFVFSGVIYPFEFWSCFNCCSFYVLLFFTDPRSICKNDIFKGVFINGDIFYFPTAYLCVFCTTMTTSFARFCIKKWFCKKVIFCLHNKMHRIVAVVCFITCHLCTEAEADTGLLPSEFSQTRKSSWYFDA